MVDEIELEAAKKYLEDGDLTGLDETTRKRLGELRGQEEKAEIEKYLENTIELGTSPVGMIQLELGEGECSRKDINRALEIRNRLIGFSEESTEGALKNALVNIYRESNSLHVSFVFLNEEGLKSYQQVIEELNQEGVDAKTALGVPEENDQQFIVHKEGRFTMYGSAVLAMVRGEIGDIKQDAPVYQLSKKGAIGALEGYKKSSIKKAELDPKKIDWTSQDQVDRIPENLFNRIDSSDIQEIQINTDDYVFVKIDINDSSKRFSVNRVDVDDKEKVRLAVINRELNATSDFRHLVDSAEMLRLRLNAAGLETYITGVLGDSLVLVLPKKEAKIIGEDGQELVISGKSVFEYIIEKNFVDSKPETFLKPKLEENEGRGHISTIELPFVKENDENSNMTTLFMADGEVIAFDRIWNGEEERAAEQFHKSTKQPVTRVVRYQDLENV